MNNERYNQIIDEVYNKYTTKYMGYDDVPSKELFLFEIRTNKEFSEKWGLKIEERELSLVERIELISYYGMDALRPEYRDKWMEENNIPTKLITIKYNDETLEGYE